MPVEDIYNKIKEIYITITTQEKNEELDEDQFLIFQEKVEAAVDDVLTRLEGVTGLKRAIAKPRTGLINRNIKRARGQLQRGSTVSQAVSKVVEKIPAQLKQKPNPIPTLRKWWKNVASTARRLREKAGKKGADVTEEQAEVQAEVETIQEVERRFKILSEVIGEIKKLDPRKSAKLVGLYNKLGEYLSIIFNGLKNLKGLRRSKKQIAEASAEIEEAVRGAEAATSEIEKELSKYERLNAWLQKKRSMPNIDLKGAFYKVIGKIPEKVLNKIPGMNRRVK